MKSTTLEGGANSYTGLSTNQKIRVATTYHTVSQYMIGQLESNLKGIGCTTKAWSDKG